MPGFGKSGTSRIFARSSSADTISEPPSERDDGVERGRLGARSLPQRPARRRRRRGREGEGCGGRRPRPQPAGRARARAGHRDGDAEPDRETRRGLAVRRTAGRDDRPGRPPSRAPYRPNRSATGRSVAEPWVSTPPRAGRSAPTASRRGPSRNRPRRTRDATSHEISGLSEEHPDETEDDDREPAWTNRWVGQRPAPRAWIQGRRPRDRRGGQRDPGLGRGTRASRRGSRRRTRRCRRR